MTTPLRLNKTGYAFYVLLWTASCHLPLVEGQGKVVIAIISLVWGWDCHHRSISLFERFVTSVLL